jgi:hypothetical protein
MYRESFWIRSMEFGYHHVSKVSEFMLFSVPSYFVQGNVFGMK